MLVLSNSLERHQTHHPTGSLPLREGRGDRSFPACYADPQSSNGCAIFFSIHDSTTASGNPARGDRPCHTIHAWIWPGSYSRRDHDCDWQIALVEIFEQTVGLVSITFTFFTPPGTPFGQGARRGETAARIFGQITGGGAEWLSCAWHYRNKSPLPNVAQYTHPVDPHPSCNILGTLLWIKEIVAVTRFGEMK
jgi:hypothetical protein